MMSMSQTNPGREFLNPSRARILMGLILLAGTGLRLYRLNSGLWFDEIITNVMYAHLPYRAIVTTFDSENQHFLYSLLAHTSFLLFGESPWALRLPAVLFGVGSLLALYLFACQVTTRTEAVLASALMAFSYHHIWFSQNARGYTGLLFWTLLSSWMLVVALKERRLSNWTWYAVFAALGMYTHMTMGFVLAGQFLAALATLISRARANWEPETGSGKPYWGATLYGFLLAGLLTLLLYAPVIPQVLRTVGGSEVSVVTEWKSPLWTVLEIIRGLEIGFALWVIGLAAIALLAAGLLSYARTRPVVLGLFLFPPVIGALAVIAIGHHLWPRFFFFALGFGALVVVRGVMASIQLLEKVSVQPTLAFRLGVLASVLMVLVSALAVPKAFGPKQDYEGAYQFVQSNLKAGDEVVTVSLTDFPYQEYFRAGWDSVKSLDDLDSIRLRARTTWVVYTFPPVLESVYPDIMASLQRDFKLVKQFPGTVGQGTIYVSESSAKPAALR